jgi:hypothetical protein
MDVAAGLAIKALSDSPNIIYRRHFTLDRRCLNLAHS